MWVDVIKKEDTDLLKILRSYSNDHTWEFIEQLFREKYNTEETKKLLKAYADWTLKEKDLDTPTLQSCAFFLLANLNVSWKNCIEIQDMAFDYILTSEDYEEIYEAINAIKKILPWTPIPFEEDFYNYLREVSDSAQKFQKRIESILWVEPKS